MNSRKGSSTQQQDMDKVVEEHKDIFSSPIGVPLQLSDRVLHQSDPRCVTTQWIDLLTFCYREIWDQEVSIGTIAERAHQPKIITVWDPNYIGTEEGWDLETLYWLLGDEHDRCLE